ncbi:MAG TPA: hypothetical protein VMV55_00855 [Methanoregula sp.]|nr:hypothetical protein [Methanoregula sp.]
MATEELKQQLTTIEAYKKAGKSMMIFLCDPYHLPEIHRLHIEEVQLDLERDLYQPPGSKNFALHLGALERLGNVAGIDWIPSVTDAKTITTTMVHYIATGFYSREYGKRVSVQGEGMTDLDVIKDDLQAQYEVAAKTYNKGKDYIDACVSRDFRAKRKKRLQLARADACAQVYRKLLGLGSAYPKAQFTAPIVIIRCVVAPDYTDEETRKLLRDGAVNAALGLYGPHSTQPSLPAPELPVSESGDYTGSDTQTVIPEVVEEDPPVDDPERSAFFNSSESDQKDTLDKLMFRKGYKFQDGYDFSMVKASRYLEFYDTLVKMEDQDIPF